MKSAASEYVFPVGRLDLHGAIDASRRLQLMPEADGYVVDMKYLSYVEPFGMLYFARQINSHPSRSSGVKWRMENFTQHTYAAHMNFFAASGFELNSISENMAGTDRYIPISSIKIRDLHIEAGQGAKDVHDVIEERASQMARVLSYGEGGDAEAALRFSLREVLRNVVEHSNADHIWYAAQYWPTKQIVELCILDEGIGVRSALSRNPHLNIDSDFRALSLALMPGVSGVAYEGREPNRDSDWANSGYGLFMMSELCSRGGSFALCSGGAILLREGGQERSLPGRSAGTALRLNLHLPALGKLRETLSELNKKGEEIARRQTTAIKNASKSSRIA